MPEQEPDLYKKYPELFHYTTWEGLAGMVASGDIWATRYDHLNDASEVTHLSEYLLRSLEPYAIDRTRLYVRGSLRRKRQADKFGGIVKAARYNAKQTIKAAYDVSFLGRRGFPPHFVPYMASFCSHQDDNDYLKEHGLLSQWRAYGNSNGRFALVFDTKGLHEMLLAVSKLIAFAPLKFSPVVYDNESFDINGAFPILVEELRRHHGYYYEEGEPDLSDSHLPEEFIGAATCLKNRAFAEEREVRIVAVPLTEDLRRKMMESTGEDEAAGKALAKTKYRNKNGVYIPYVSLFERLQKRLPIRRVIVGPCRDQSRAVSMARDLLKGFDVPILVSSIPLRD